MPGPSRPAPRVAARPARQDPGHLGYRGGPGQRAVPGQQPGPDAHRRAGLEHPQHVREPLRPAQVVDQGDGGQADRAECADLPHPGEPAVPGQLGAGRQHRRRARQAAEEQVPGHVRHPPGRFLDHGAAVVGAELGVRHHQLLSPAPVAADPPVPGAAAGRLPRLAVLDLRHQRLTSAGRDRGPPRWRPARPRRCRRASTCPAGPGW